MYAVLNSVYIYTKNLATVPYAMLGKLYIQGTKYSHKMYIAEGQINNSRARPEEIEKI